MSGIIFCPSLRLSQSRERCSTRAAACKVDEAAHNEGSTCGRRQILGSSVILVGGGLLASAACSPGKAAVSSIAYSTSHFGNSAIETAYDKFSTDYDRLDQGFAAEALGFPKLRQQLLGRVQGVVLECGVGTGAHNHARPILPRPEIFRFFTAQRMEYHDFSSMWDSSADEEDVITFCRIT